MWLLRLVLSCSPIHPEAYADNPLHPFLFAIDDCSGLKFTALGLRSSQANPTEELSTSFTKAYDGSLRPYHGMLVRPVFYVCPFHLPFVYIHFMIEY